VADVAVRGPVGPFAALIRAAGRADGREHRFDLPVLRLAGGGVTAVDNDGGAIVVDNGAMQLRVVPDFGGSVTSLVWAGAERLRSSYPSAGPFMWAGHWFGGVHPTMGWIGGPYLAREAFTGSVAERIGRDGAVWRGARVTCEPKQRDRRWLRVEADYLSLPGSNVLLTVLRWTNRTTTRMRPEREPCLAVWLAAGQRPTAAHWVRDGRREVQEVGTFSRDMRSESWAAVSDPGSGLAALLVPGGRQAKTYVEDFAEHGQHLGMWMPMTLGPGETREIAAWLVFCPVEQMDAYAALRDAW
jgi:hypothetical protein